MINVASSADAEPPDAAAGASREPGRRGPEQDAVQHQTAELPGAAGDIRHVPERKRGNVEY